MVCGDMRGNPITSVINFGTSEITPVNSEKVWAYTFGDGLIFQVPILKTPFINDERPVYTYLCASVVVKFNHCANAYRPFDGQKGFQTYSTRQRRFDGDGDDTCKWTSTTKFTVTVS